MPLDESKYDTMRFMRCKNCGNVYAAGIGVTPECPECSSNSSAAYRPDESGKDGGANPENRGV